MNKSIDFEGCSKL